MAYINQVQGQDANNAPVTAQPVLVSGTDGSSNRAVLTDQFGRQSVTDFTDDDYFHLLLVESRLHTLILAQAFGITDDLDALRASISNPLTERS